MPPLPEAIITVLGVFAPLFSNPVWSQAQVLLVGAVLCRGPHTVGAVLRGMGLGGERCFERYHRVLSRARWSGWQGSKILLGVLVRLLPKDWVPIIGVDETLERRRGKRIKAKGYYRDAVRSTRHQVVKCFGLKWISLMLIVRLPWSSRPWALPFLTLLAPSERASRAAGKRHKTTVDWNQQAVKAVSRWLGKRPWLLVGDGAYACVRLGWTCVASQGVLVSRLRLDAQLYEPPPPAVAGRRGRKPQKGAKLPALKTRGAEAQTHGLESEVGWYGGERRRVRLLSGTALWHRAGQPPLPIRWVLVVQATGEPEPVALFCTCPACAPRIMVMAFVLRWNVEVTFEESRRHLGVETQRQWSDLAIARTTPALLGRFSLVCLMAYHLNQGARLRPRTAAWYLKDEATFSDALALVRRVLWAAKYFNPSALQDDQVVFQRPDWETLLDQLVQVG